MGDGVMNRRKFLVGVVAALFPVPKVLALEAPVPTLTDALMSVEIGYYESVRIFTGEVAEFMQRHHIPPNRDGCYVAFVHPDNRDFLRELRGR